VAEDKTARWLLSSIDGARKERSISMLANACAALTGQAPMAFGMIVGDFPGRDQVREHALEALRLLAADLNDTEVEPLFELVDRYHLDIDLADRRARRDTARETELAGVTAEIRSAIATLAPIAVVHAATALRGNAIQIAGVTLPRDAPARPQLLEQSLARLTALVAELPDEECAPVVAAIRRARLPVDIAARGAELATRRRAERPPPSDEPFNPELERAIIDHPDDRDAYSVLADWLQDRHPRGELIALQLRAETEPQLKVSVERYLETHAAVLLGSLARFQTTRDGRDRPALIWRRGFIDRLVLAHDADMDDGDDPTTCAEVLELALAHPSARLLRAVDIGVNGVASEDTLEDVVEALAGQAPPHLREVLLGDFDREQCEISWFHIGNIAPVWTIPELRRLVVHGADFDLGTVAHAQLEHLEIQTGNLSVANAVALAAAKLPALRHLDIWYGDPNYGGDATLAEAMPLLRRDDLPALVHLGLKNAIFADELCSQLANSQLCRQLRSLDLSLGTLSDAALPALRTFATAVPALEKLDVSKTYLSNDGVAELARMFPRATITANGRREGGDEARYVAVGE
jgi:uncharacterized protein (TIGR02996 family)